MKRASEIGQGGDGGRLELAAGAACSFRPHRGGSRLRCERGLLLVTQEGDPEDHLLGPGAELRSRPRGRLAVWALEAGVLRVDGSLRTSKTAPEASGRESRNEENFHRFHTFVTGPKDG